MTFSLIGVLCCVVVFSLGMQSLLAAIAIGKTVSNLTFSKIVARIKKNST